MRYIPIQSYDNYIEANIIRSRLEQEEISCWLQDEASATTAPFLANSIGGIKLMVAESQVERAAQLLRQFRSEKESILKCPRCQSSNVESITTPRRASTWIGAIIGFLTMNLAVSRRVYHCFNCGFEFDEMDEKTV